MDVRNFQFISTDEGFPERGRPVLIEYEKNLGARQSSEKVIFIIQGWYIPPLPTRTGELTTGSWYDFADRLICLEKTVNRKHNKVLKWAYLPE
jgi:hypothetical protein